MAWGNAHFAPEGASVQLFDAKTGSRADPMLIDRNTGRPITETDHVLAPGPAAPERTRRRYAAVGRAAPSAARKQESARGRRAAKRDAP